jgi:outer membrane protein assembly factor BamE (lipoprotein component of BamABCDE complex)
MNSHISKLLLSVGIAATLGACASISSTPERDLELAQIHPGLTQDEVRSLVGNPGNVTGKSPSGERLWVYSFTDSWGYSSEFDVEFDASGVVESTSAERIN